MRDLVSVARFSVWVEVMDATIELIKKIAIVLELEESNISLRSNGEIWCINGNNSPELVAFYHEGMIFEYVGAL